MIYAQNTDVSCERSKGEIESTLRRYGADQFMSGWKDDQAAVQFRLKNRLVRFILPLPDPKADEFTRTGCAAPYAHQAKDRSHHSHTQGCFKLRPIELAMKMWDQACRQRWRALALAIKAKLEAVECGITSFDEEFLAHIIVPGTKGMTMAEFVMPKLEEAYSTNKAPQLSWDGK